jgi:ATP-dependent RNA helicase DeaD
MDTAAHMFLIQARKVRCGKRPRGQKEFRIIMPFPTLPAAFESALAAQGYKEPTPVQAAVLAEDRGDADLLVSAQTGSGKTVAFGLSIGPTLLAGEDRLARAQAPLALVIAPTRELAQQVARELEWLYKNTGAVVVCCVGGMDARREARQLSNGAHIVVGTPGRLRDHMERGNADFTALRAVVLDEADEMLDLGFKDDLEAILEGTPEERRTLLFSATLAKDIVSLAKNYQRNAVRIDTTTRDVPHGDIEYRAIRCAPNEIELAVVNVLRFYGSGCALVFCATRESVRHLFGSLRERGFSAVALSGELSQKERTDALQALRDGHARVCVATDVAARGLDLPDLNLVIHAELPQNKAALLHRSGRTGRAGRKGTSVLMVPTTKQRKAEQLLGAAGVAATWSSPPSAEAVRAADRDALLNDPMLTEVPGEEDEALAVALLEASGPEKVALALIRLHRSRLPEPEDVYDPGPANVRGPKPARGGDRYEREGRPERSYERDDRGAQGGERPPPRERRDYSENMGSGEGDAPWFVLSVGRNSNADPKWLIPLICRLGHVTKNDIGSIKIFDRETKFEIDPRMAGRFYAAVQAHPDDAMRIEPASNPGDARGAPRGKPRSDGPPRGGPRGADRGGERTGPPRGGPRQEDRGPRSSPFAPAGGARDDRPRDDRPRPGKSYSEAPRHDGPRRGPKGEPFKGGAPKGGKRSNASNASGGGAFDIGSGGGGPPPFAKKQYTKKPRK